MSEKDIVIKEAYDVAKKFLSVRDPGESEQHLKAIVKVIPEDISNDFLYYLSEILKRRRRIETVRVNHKADSRNKLTLSSIVDSFIRDLSRSAPTGEWKKLRSLRESILLGDISFSEAYKLIDECMDLKRQQVKKPLIFLVNLGNLEGNYDTLKFVNMLKNLARECGYQWLITSHSPLLMLFMGELLTGSQYSSQGYYILEEEFVISGDTDKVTLRIPSMVFEITGGTLKMPSVVDNSIFMFGEKIDEDKKYDFSFGASYFDSPLLFAIIEANVGGYIVLDFSSHLNFQLVPRETMFENLNHKLKDFIYYRVREGFNLFDLYVRHAKEEDQINHHVLLPPESVIHIHVLGEERDKNFIFLSTTD